MGQGRLLKESRFISFVLRHRPDVLGINIDRQGWTNADELVNSINTKTKYNITLDDLVYIVKTDDKQRYSFNTERDKIRANQGHSIAVEIEFEEKRPPAMLYHGTCMGNMDSINKTGIKRMSRLHVHMSDSINTAIEVGARHSKKNGDPVVYVIDSARMYNDGYKFYLSCNNIWLTKVVPHRYIKLLP